MERKEGAERKGPPVPYKSTGLAAVLALILGLFGLWGIGHVYVGKLKRGIVLLVVGIILTVFGLISVLGTMIVGGLAGLVGGGIVLLIILLVGWIWQIFDAYKLAKQYNDYVYKHGKAPW